MTSVLAPFLAHICAAWLHFLPANELAPQRKLSPQINTYWWMMVGCVVFHLSFGIDRALSHAVSYAVFFEWIHIITLAFLTACIPPLFIAELERPPKFLSRLKTVNPVASYRALSFGIALGLASLLTTAYIWLIFGSPPPIWRFIANQGQFIFISWMGILWAGFLILGFRPQANADVYTKRPFHVVFAIMLVVSLTPSFIEMGPMSRFLQFLGPLTSVPFALLFAWYRFRLTFLDVVLKQGLRLVALSLLIIGSTSLIGDSLNSPWALFVLIAAIVGASQIFRIDRLLERIWIPALSDPVGFNKQLHMQLTQSADKRDAIIRTQQLLAKTFQSDIEISDISSGKKPEIVIDGEPMLFATYGPVKGVFPWYANSLERLESALRTLQVNLNMLSLLDQRHHQEITLNRLSAARIKAELTALRAQIKPHFLFNTLNAIHTFIHDDPKLAEQTIEDLSQLMRGILVSSDQDLVPLSKELEIVTAYLNIEQARFGDQLTVVAENNVEDEAIKLPPLSLQPIVENAVKYGSLNGKAMVSIKLHQYIDRVEIVVEDNGPGLQEGDEGRGFGMALENIQTRMSQLFAQEGSLKVSPKEGGGTQVRMTLPRPVRPVP